MRNKPYWEYAIEEASQSSAIGGSPGWAITYMLFMCFCTSISEGIGEYNAKEKEKKDKADEDARMARLERIKAMEDAMLRGQASTTPHPTGAASRPTTNRTTSAPSSGASRRAQSAPKAPGVPGAPSEGKVNIVDEGPLRAGKVSGAESNGYLTPKPSSRKPGSMALEALQKRTSKLENTRADSETIQRRLEENFPAL